MKPANLNARSAFTKEPIAEVSYKPMLFLGANSKTHAIASSANLTASNPKNAELGPYKRAHILGSSSFLELRALFYSFLRRSKGFGFGASRASGMPGW